MNTEPKILLVDDKKINRQLLTRHLLSAGYAQVIEASSGQEALKKAKEQKPDLVLLDIVMPGKRGTTGCFP